MVGCVDTMSEYTYTAVPKLFGIDWRREIQAPSVPRRGILPVYEAFRGLA